MQNCNFPALLSCYFKFGQQTHEDDAEADSTLSEQIQWEITFGRIQVDKWKNILTVWQNNGMFGACTNQQSHAYYQH